MTPGFVLLYASVRYQRVTRVELKTEEVVRHWFKHAELWSDVARVRAEAPDGRVLADTTIAHRIETDADRELVAAMDPLDRRFLWPPAVRAAAEQRLVLATPEVCRCGHGRAQHAGADGSGSCAACSLCKKFWRKP